MQHSRDPACRLDSAVSHRRTSSRYPSRSNRFLRSCSSTHTIDFQFMVVADVSVKSLRTQITLIIKKHIFWVDLSHKHLILFEKLKLWRFCFSTLVDTYTLVINIDLKQCLSVRRYHYLCITRKGQHPHDVQIHLLYCARSRCIQV